MIRSTLSISIAIAVCLTGFGDVENVVAASRPSSKTIATGIEDLPCRNSFIAVKKNVTAVAYFKDGNIATRRSINGASSWEPVRTIALADGEDAFSENTDVDCSVQIVATSSAFYVGAYLKVDIDLPGYYQFWKSFDGRSWSRAGQLMDSEPQMSQVIIAATANRVFLAAIRKITANPECLVDQTVWCENSYPLQVYEVTEKPMTIGSPVTLGDGVLVDDSGWGAFALAGGDSIIATWSDSVNQYRAIRKSSKVWSAPAGFMTWWGGSPVHQGFETRVATSGTKGILAWAGTSDSVLRWRMTTNGGRTWGAQRIKNDSTWGWSMVRNVWATGTTFRVAVERWDDAYSWISSDIYRISNSGATRLWRAPAGQSVIGGAFAQARSIVVTRKAAYDPMGCDQDEWGNLVNCSDDLMVYSLYSYSSP